MNKKQVAPAKKQKKTHNGTINRREEEVENRSLVYQFLSCPVRLLHKKKERKKERKKKPKSGIAHTWTRNGNIQKKSKNFLGSTRRSRKPVFFFFWLCCLEMLLAVIRPWLVGR
jgi:hypothetical protein